MKEGPIVLQRSATIRDAARLILEHRFRNVPVVDEGGRYLGVVSANRLLGMVLPKAAVMEEAAIESLPFVKDVLEDFRERWREVADTPVTDCLETGLQTVTPDTPIAETLLSLYHNRTSLPVVEQETGRLVGMVSHWTAGAAIVGEGEP
jgi:CBS-domain-containing membrane protein